MEKKFSRTEYWEQHELPEQPRFIPGSLNETFAYVNNLAKLEHRLLSPTAIPNDTQREYVQAAIETEAKRIISRTDHKGKVMGYITSIRFTDTQLGDAIVDSLEAAQKKLVDKK